MATDQHRTLVAELWHETPRIKNSRFIARAAPVVSEAEAKSVIARARAEYPDALHHCFAWRLGPVGAQYRFSDDGEPGGSAGRPILQQIEGHDLTDVAVVVSRYFGGTKLGVGGLIRAYAGCAAAVLDRGEVRVVEKMERIAVCFPYECTSGVQVFLAQQSVTPVASEYGVDVRMTLEVPCTVVESLLAGLRDATAGRLQWETGTR